MRRKLHPNYEGSDKRTPRTRTLSTPTGTKERAKVVEILPILDLVSTVPAELVCPKMEEKGGTIVILRKTRSHQESLYAY
jgi:hypothetical protein